MASQLPIKVQLRDGVPRYISPLLAIAQKVRLSLSIMRSMFATIFAVAGVQARSLPRQASNPATLLTDLSTISQYWGEITPYSDNPED